MSFARLHKGARVNLIWTALCFLPFYAVTAALILLGMAIYSMIDQETLLPRHELTVGLKKVDVNIFRVLEQGSAPSFSAKDLEVIAAQPGVTSLHPVCYGSQPAEARIAFFGREFRTEMVIQAFDRGWLPEFDKELSGWTPDKLVPIVVNSSILAIYNHAYSKSYNLPELSEAALKAPLLTLNYGEPGRQVQLQGRVVGLSPKVALGAAVPREVLDYLHQQLGIEAPPVTEVVLHSEAGEDLERTRLAVEKLGFVINEPGQFLQLVGIARKIAMRTFQPIFLFLGLIALLILNLGYGAIIQQSRGNYAELRGGGRTRAALLYQVLSELVLMTLLFVSLGSALGQALAHWVNDTWFSPFLARLITTPFLLDLPQEPLFWFNAGILLGMLVLVTPRAFWALRALPGPSAAPAPTTLDEQVQ